MAGTTEQRRLQRGGREYFAVASSDLGIRILGADDYTLFRDADLALHGRAQIPEAQIVECAIQSLGLRDLGPFEPREKVIEYRIEKPKKTLRGMRLTEFADETSTDSPAPGGGSVASYCGALSAALGTMVGNLTHGRKGQEADWPEMERIAVAGQGLKDAFLLDVDRDTDAFNEVMTAIRMPKGTDAEVKARDRALDAANRGATLVPLGVLRRSVDSLKLAEATALRGNPNSLSDAGVAALTGLASAEGAFYNVRINLRSMAEGAQE